MGDIGGWAIGRRRVTRSEYLAYTAQRLIDGSQRDNESGCLLWQRYVMPEGYGQIGFRGKIELVHRVAYLIWVGEIPEGLHIDHVKTRGCRSRVCIEPAHLEAVTQAENNRRLGITHCRRGGHPLSGDNLYIQPSNQSRRCRACAKEPSYG